MDEPVTLMNMLAAREGRSLVRKDFFHRQNKGTCLLQVTVNIPGPDKNSPMIRDIFESSLASLMELFPEGELLPSSALYYNTGPEAWIFVPERATSVKRKTGLLEEKHVWGRLWDIDVFTSQDCSLSRSDVGLKERSCFLCGRPAHECSRSRAHDKNELIAFILNLYEANRLPPSSL
jgi:holo-ACP synthase